ncbi:MAG TPA: SDR family NAD(P)-dependent oxidoreductase [Natronosporangium sp.]
MRESERVRVSIITGVSRGLGAELMAQLSARGDRVVGIGRDPTRLTVPERVQLHEADLARPETLPAPDQFADWLAGASCAALVHNAATVEPIGAVGALPPDQVATAVTVNLTAPMLLTNAFLAALPADLPATILFISSRAAKSPIEGWSVYGATKRAGEVFFDALAGQLAGRRRVSVAIAQPGVMDTGMQATIRRAAAAGAWFPDADRFLAMHERGELPSPAEVAAGIIAEHLLEVTVQ